MAITLPVKAEPDDRSLDRTADEFEKRFSKAGQDSGKGFARGFEQGSEKLQAAYDKMTDATGRLRVEQAKLNDLQEKGIKDSRLVAQVERLEAARRKEESALRAVTKAYGEQENAATGLIGAVNGLNSSAARAMTTIGNLAAGSRLGALTLSVGQLSSGFAEAGASVGGFGAAFASAGLIAGGAVVVGLAAVAAGAVAVTNSLYDMGETWDQVVDSIQVKTGLTGDALDQIAQSVKDVGSAVPESNEVIGNLAAQVAQSLNLIGSSAEPAITALGHLKHMGVDVNVHELGMAFRSLNIDQDQYVASLEKMLALSQSSGQNIDSITEAIAGGKGSFDAFGLSLDDVLGLMKRFEEQGMSPDQAISALNKAFAVLSKAGHATKEGLQQSLDEIKAEITSGDLADAEERLNNLFGAKGGGGSWLKVMQDDAINLSSSLAAPSTSIQGLADDTYDAAEAWALTKKEFTNALEPMGTELRNFVQEELKDFGEWFKDHKPEIIGFFTGVATQVVNFAEILTGALGGALYAIGAAGEHLPWVGDKFAAVKDAGSDVMNFANDLGLLQNKIQSAGDAANDHAQAERDVATKAQEAATGTQAHADAVQNLHEKLAALADDPKAFGGGTFLPGMAGGLAGGPGSPTSPGEIWPPLSTPEGPHRWAAGGRSNRDFAHQAMMPFWESRGFTVGDHGADKYGEHQNGALDVMVPSLAAGQQVLRQALSDPNVYGAIFDNKTYGYGHGTTPQDYSAGHTGNPTQDHQDHVHIWYHPGGTNNIAPGGGMQNFAPAGMAGFKSFAPGGGFAQDMSEPSPLPGTPSPIPGLKPGPVGSTPGDNEYGEPGYYRPDSKSVRSAERGVEDSGERIERADAEVAKANKAVTDAQAAKADAEAKIAKINNETTPDEKARLQKQLDTANDQLASANERVKQAEKGRQRAREDAQDAATNMDEARRGRFTPASKASQSAGRGRSGQQIGAPIAQDFGLSQGLPGLAENLTNFLGNIAFAPALGALSGLSAGLDPTGRAQTGSGLSGILGALAMGDGGMGMGQPTGAPMGGSSLGILGGSPGPGQPPGGGLGISGGLPGMASTLTNGFGGMTPGVGGAGGMGAPVGLGGMFGSPLGAPPGPGMAPQPGMAPTGGTPGVGGAGGAPQQSTMGGTSPGGGPGGGGFGGAGSTGLGGMAMQGIQAGISAAGMALDTAMPGAGTAAAMAANIGVQEGNRAIGQLGKAAGLTVGGVMETLLPANSKLGDPNANWFGKLAAGFAGAKPSIPNMASQPADKPANSQQQNPLDDPAKANAAAGDPSKGGVTVNYTNNMATEDRAGADLTNHLVAMNAGVGV